MDKVIVSLITVFVMLFLFLIYKKYDEMNRMIAEMGKRLNKLESANRKRMPYEAYEHLIDAMSALDAEEREVEIKRIFLGNARSHMEQAMAAGTKRETN